MNFLRWIADNQNPNSIANSLRRKRFKFFLELLESLPRPVRVLDVGGTETFWQNLFWNHLSEVKLTILNLGDFNVTLPNTVYVQGNARDLSMFKDKEFDVVFSNSVIEHVGAFEEQKQMADEIRRVGKSYVVQTPAYSFPIEPHFLFPCFQFLPEFFQTLLVRNFKLGWTNKAQTKEDALQLVRSVKLLRRSEFVKLFPDAEIRKEKFIGLSKSFIAFYGFTVP